MTARELGAYAALDQWSGITRYRLVDGFENGVEIIEIRDGAGLRIGVCPARGLDIVFAEARGLNLTYRNPNGFAHPAFYSAQNRDWLRGAPNGLVTTCGLSSFGPPCEDEGERFGLHDRYSYLPAREVSAQTLDGGVWEVRGIVRQARVFGANLRLERTIRVEAGRVQMRDQITNDGFEAAPFVVLYHCNFGFPLLEAGARVEVNSESVVARDGDYGTEHWARIESPQAGRAEEVFFHHIAGETGQASIANAARGVEVKLRYRTAQLPHFTQWKAMGAGNYALGLEPSNAPLASRAELRARGELPNLEAGERQIFELEWEINHE